MWTVTVAVPTRLRRTVNRIVDRRLTGPALIRRDQRPATLAVRDLRTLRILQIIVDDLVHHRAEVDPPFAALTVFQCSPLVRAVLEVDRMIVRLEVVNVDRPG